MHFRDMVEEDRRTALKTIGGTALTAAALAGCMGGGDESGSDINQRTPTSTPVEEDGQDEEDVSAENTATERQRDRIPVEQIGYNRNQLLDFAPHGDNISEEWSPSNPTDVEPGICAIDYESANNLEFGQLGYQMGEPHIYFGTDNEKESSLQPEHIKGVTSRGHKAGVEAIAASPENVRKTIEADPNTEVVSEEESRMYLEKTVPTWVEGKDFDEKFRHAIELVPWEDSGTLVAYALDERVRRDTVVRENDSPEENLDGVIETLNGARTAFEDDQYSESNDAFERIWSGEGEIPELDSVTPPSKMIAYPRQVAESYDRTWEGEDVILAVGVSNWNEEEGSVNGYRTSKLSNGEWSDPVKYLEGSLTENRLLNN